jgi:hypothetical protein
VRPNLYQKNRPTSCPLSSTLERARVRPTLYQNNRSTSCPLSSTLERVRVRPNLYQKNRVPVVFDSFLQYSGEG